MLLRKPSDERIGRGGADRPFERFDLSGEDSEQGALPGPVGAHDADDVTRGYREVEPFEQGPVGEATGHIAGAERSGHGMNRRTSPRDRNQCVGNGTGVGLSCWFVDGG